MNHIRQHLPETAVAIVLIFLLFCFINPFHFIMTDALHMTLLGIIVALFAIFAMFLWREGVADEREELHKSIATRFAYTAAGALLLLGTVIQASLHDIDPWLPGILAAMVLAKILGRWYAEKYN